VGPEANPSPCSADLPLGSESGWGSSIGCMGEGKPGFTLALAGIAVKVDHPRAMEDRLLFNSLGNWNEDKGFMALSPPIDRIIAEEEELSGASAIIQHRARALAG